MLILGLNMFHADASAAIVDDGKILFAVGENITQLLAVTTISVERDDLTTTLWEIE